MIMCPWVVLGEGVDFFLGGWKKSCVFLMEFGKYVYLCSRLWWYPRWVCCDARI